MHTLGAGSRPRRSGGADGEPGRCSLGALGAWCALWVGAWSVSSSTVCAQPAADADFDANAQWLSPGPSAFLAQRSVEVAPSGALTAGYVLGWHHRPLVLRQDGGREESAVAGQLTGDMLVSVGLWGRAQVGVVAPLVLLQPGVGLTPLREGASTGGRLEALVLRDPRFVLDGVLLERARDSGTALMASFVVGLPLGRRRDFGGGHWGLAPSLTAERAFGPWLLAAHVAYRWVDAVRRIGRARLGDRLVTQVGLQRRWARGRWGAALELTARWQLAAQPEGAPSQHGYEALFSGSWFPWRDGDLVLIGGVGAGLGGVGTASFRASFGVRYALPLPGSSAERLTRPLPAPAR